MKENNIKDLKYEIIKKHEKLFAKKLDLESEANRLMLEIFLLNAQHTLNKVNQLNHQIDDKISEMDYLRCFKLLSKLHQSMQNSTIIIDLKRNLTIFFLIDYHEKPVAVYLK